MRSDGKSGVVIWMTTAVAAVATVAMLLAVPVEGSAQVRVGISVDWWDWIGDVRVHGSVDYGDARRAPVYRDYGYVHPPVVEVERRPARARVRGRKGRGPAFCRSGRGHPVHGWGWCVRKGFAPAHPGRARPTTYRGEAVPCCAWYPADLGPVRYRSDRYHRMGRPLGHEEVVSILGRVVVDDLYARVGYRRAVPLEGRWYPSAGEAHVLQVRAGDTPVAEFTDLDGDRWVDRTYLARRRSP